MASGGRFCRQPRHFYFCSHHDNYTIITTDMTDRASELEAAASLITLESLDAANAAVIISCQEYLRRADLFSRRLATVEPDQLHKFGRALALTILGHLPTRPGTCPFCIQYERSRSCEDCGYATTHGRCDCRCLFIQPLHRGLSGTGKVNLSGCRQIELPSG